MYLSLRHSWDGGALSFQTLHSGADHCQANYFTSKEWTGPGNGVSYPLCLVEGIFLHARRDPASGPMSSNVRAYVENYSPYKGTALIIHMKMGDLANDTYGQRLFMGDKKMAALCRCSEKTLQRTRNKMIRHGLLERVTPAQGRKGAEYRLLMPEIGGQIDRLSEIDRKSTRLNSS